MAIVAYLGMAFAAYRYHPYMTHLGTSRHFQFVTISSKQPQKARNQLLPIDSRCAPVRATLGLRMHQQIIAIDLVVQSVEWYPVSPFAFACNAVGSF